MDGGAAGGLGGSERRRVSHCYHDGYTIDQPVGTYCPIHGASVFQDCRRSLSTGEPATVYDARGASLGDAVTLADQRIQVWDTFLKSRRLLVGIPDAAVPQRFLGHN